MNESEAIRELEWAKNRLMQNTHMDNNRMTAFNMAISTLEKQIPSKPILKHDVSTIHVNKGNMPHEWKTVESDNWHCPICDCIVGQRIVVHEIKHDQRKKNYCEKCGQAINWNVENKDLCED